MRQSPLREESLGAQGRLGVRGGRLEGMTGWVEQRGRGCEAARYRRAALGGSSSGRASGVAEGGKRARPLDARQQPPPGASSALHHGGGPAGHAHRSPRANHRAALPPPRSVSSPFPLFTPLPSPPSPPPRPLTSLSPPALGRARARPAPAHPPVCYGRGHVPPAQAVTRPGLAPPPAAPGATAAAGSSWRRRRGRAGSGPVTGAGPEAGSGAGGAAGSKRGGRELRGAGVGAAPPEGPFPGEWLCLPAP